MEYTGRDWDNTDPKVTKEDFKRIESGVKNNSTQINVLKEIRKTLFSGSVTNTATLSESINGGIYDKFVITTGTGNTYMLYTINFSGKVVTASTMTVLTATGYLVISFASDGQNITLTYNGAAQPLRTFLACKSGGIV